jgi:ACT domain-containing protein
MKENSIKLKAMVIEQLNKTPIIQVACEKLNLSRATFYLWKQTDKEFAKKVDGAILTGRSLVNDLAESQLVNAIKDKNLSAITYWLRHHHRDYAEKLQIKHTIEDESLTPEQEALVREALRLASSSQAQIINHDRNDNDLSKHNANGTDRNDDEGQKSKSGDN